MDDVERIIKAYYYKLPESKQARTKIFFLQFMMQLLEADQIGDLGIAGQQIHLSKSGKRAFKIPKW